MMRRAGPCLLLALAAAVGPAPLSPAAPVTAETLTDALVQEAARAIVDELYRTKAPDRFWDPPRWDPDADGQRAQVGGYTALVVLALLYEGESYQDPRLHDAVTHLQRASLEGTYAVAVRTHVWAQLPDKFHPQLEADTRWLMGAYQPKQHGWGYEAKPRSDWYDNSLAQYGALGLWEAAKRGGAIPRGYWEMIEQRYVGNQRPDGGWNYRGNQPVTGSMTAAGLTALFITQDYLHARDALDLEASRSRPYEAAIARGLTWMDRNFSVQENPGRDTYFFYYLYGVQRVGLASGYGAFGGRDWFRAGAAEIVNRLFTRDPDTGALRLRDALRTGRPTQLRQLAFGLMFLSRGRVPVAVNKLGGDGLEWNNRPRDVANLTHWISEETEAELSWQIVDLGGDPDAWLQAPLLYLASDEALPDAAQAPLKRYLDRGGLLLAVNEGRTSALAQSVQRAGEAMYPQYAWRTLPPDHWAYTLHFPVRSHRPALRALSNGVRELIILAPARDLSAAFQAREENNGAFPAAANIYLYASEMNRPRPRLGASPPAAAPWPAGARVVRASYEGNWNPEPLALDVPAVALGSIQTLDPRPDLVVVSGTDAHEFTEAERTAVRAFVQAGGVILFETAGGRGPFAQAAEQTCREVLGDLADGPRPLTDDRIITGEGLPDAANLSHVAYRPYTVEVLGARETTPRLAGMTIDGTARVLFSREDLSNALLDEPCWGVAGYAPASARDLLRNIVLHAVALRGGARGR